MRPHRVMRFVPPIVPASIRALLAVLAVSRAAVAQPASAREPLASLRLGPPTLTVADPFSEVVAVAEFPDGRFLVADRRDLSYYLVERSGSEMTVLGRNGSGPNEYVNAFGIVRLPGDTLALFGGNQRYLRVTPTAQFADALPIPVSILRGGGIAPAVGVDARGGYYWSGDAVGANASGFKRNQRQNIRRWPPPSERLDTVASIVDHAEMMHEKSFHPYAERDAWVVAPDGRIGVLSARDYRLRWYQAGKVIAEGPAINFVPIPITAADRDAFRAERMRQPASGMRSTAPSAKAEPSPAMRKRIEEAFADEVFPSHKPPFIENGLLRAQNGELWVQRSAAFGQRVTRIDVLRPSGARKATLDLPPGRRLVAVDRLGVYLVRVDDEGLEWLERYDWPLAAP
ncbi:MAG: hypothetical protein IT357_17355 [Gemmatimonadaceae bacterium]|nr:hypothetical protein [Gemmatimonadaceae bacterium]